jgi:site-specific DNA recombinase
MSPTHSNKLGLRYRYYVSHAILQQRKPEAGSIARVPAPEIETLVLDGIRKHLASTGEAEPPTAIADRDLIERHVDRMIVKPQALEVHLVLRGEATAQTDEPRINDLAPSQLPMTTITLAWTAPIASFAEIAECEDQGERYIRLLARLAFVSPCIITAIVDGTAPGRGLYASVALDTRCAALRTGLRPISNRYAARRNGNWKMASRDWRRKATDPGPKVWKLPARDTGAPA